MSNLLKEAIADAKTVRETAIANAKMALEEAFTPHLKSMLSAKLAEDEVEEGLEDEVTAEDMHDDEEDEDDMEDVVEEENDDIQEHEIKTESTSVEEKGSTDAEEMELLKLGEELEEELTEIVKPIGNATTNNIGYIETMEGFDVRLPKESIEQITRTIAMTPHEGFKPVVRVNMLGQIVLDFEPL